MDSSVGGTAMEHRTLYPCTSGLCAASDWSYNMKKDELVSGEYSV